MKKIIFAVIVSLCFRCLCDDPALAEALAKTGAEHASKGHYEQAKEVLYRALANDMSCGLALFELAKIEEKAGLYQRATVSLKDSPSRAAANSRLKALNPFAAKLIEALDEYARGCERVSIDNKNKYIVREIESRVSALCLSGFLLPSKMPQLDVAKKFFISSTADKIVGRWDKKDGSYVIFKNDGTLYFSADSHGGKWEVVDDSKFIIRFGWQPKIDSTCVFVSENSFDCESKAIFSKSSEIKKSKK